MHRTIELGLALFGLLIGAMHAAELTAVAKFDGTERPKNWTVNVGHWEPQDGVLVARELEKDHHAAASRWQIPMADGVVKLKVKFAGAKGFHVGFDPMPGTLDKQGHLYSLVITPKAAQIKKHKDKAKPESKDETLATTGLNGVEGQWITVELQTTGDKVQATLTAAGQSSKLEASDESFHVGKPTVVFRAMGGDLLLDDVEVTVTKPASPAKTAAKR